jgi:cell division protein FtsL
MAPPAACRPSTARAAAAARLAGAPAGDVEVAARMRYAAQRSLGTVVEVAGAAALALVPQPQPEPEAPEQGARPRHLRVVPEGLSVAQRRRRARMLVVAAISAAAVVALALVYFHVILAQRQFAIDHLGAQVHAAQTKYQSQRLEVAQLGSPQHIISMAEGPLGMMQPSKVKYLSPSSGQTVVSGQGARQALGQTRASGILSPLHAPAGDADWPQIKSQLAGSP